jgi:2,4-dienoyl-CoA reductase [(3E)-enoyl-CoA-producing], mitochondrial
MNRILKPNKSILLPYNYYKNKNVLITGGGSGIGKKIAETYSILGANVLIVGRNENKLLNSSNDIYKKSNNIVNLKSLDVRDNEAVLDLANELEKNNKLPEIVINNAAGNFISRTEDLSYNAWNSILDIVLKGTMNFTLEFGKKNIKNNIPSTFINISTTYANTGSAFVVPSAMAKAGCDNLTKSLSAEWGKYGIRLLSIAPGPIYTEGAFNRLDPNGDFSKQVVKTLPLNRLGEREELANLVTYLTSEQNNWMTGQIINLDGGEVIGNSGEFNILHKLKKEDWEKIKK